MQKGYRKKNGHRQQFSRIMIESIDFPGKDGIVASEPKKEKTVKEKAVKTEKTTKLLQLKKPKKTAKTTNQPKQLKLKKKP